MIRTLKKVILNMSLKRKIFTILCAVLIPVIAAASVGMTWITSSFTSLLYRNIAGQLSYSAQIISNHLQDIETLSYMVFSDSTVQEDMLTLKYSDDALTRSNINKRLRALLLDYYDSFRSSHIMYIDLFSGDFSTSGNSYASSKVPEEVHDAVRQEALDGNGASVWVSSYSSEYGLFLSREIRQAQYLSYDELGEEVICVDIAGIIKEAVRPGRQYEHASYLLLDGECVIYHAEDLTDEQSAQIWRQLETPYQVISLDGHDYFAVRGSLDANGWDYISMVPYDSIMGSIRQAISLFVLILVLCTGAALLLASLLIGSLTRHFKVLAGKMTAVGKGEPLPTEPAYDYSHRSDEIGILHQQFDQMTAQLQELIQTNYVNELLKNEAQLKALENQINPHFLYNTLESVNWRAKALGAEDISTMVQSLAALLRVTLSRKEAYFTLGQEIELVRSYMTIQLFRYEDRLSFSVHVPEGLLPVKLPKLTIQPLVENAIRYGLEKNPDECEIALSASLSDGVVSISVSNSGSLFEDDLLEKLKSGDISAQGHGIGLINIDQRIKLTYGDKFGLSLSNHDECATATVTVPGGEALPC